MSCSFWMILLPSSVIFSIFSWPLTLSSSSPICFFRLRIWMMEVLTSVSLLRIWIRKSNWSWKSFCVVRTRGSFFHSQDAILVLLPTVNRTW